MNYYKAILAKSYVSSIVVLKASSIKSKYTYIISSDKGILEIETAYTNYESAILLTSPPIPFNKPNSITLLGISTMFLIYSSVNTFIKFFFYKS